MVIRALSVRSFLAVPIMVAAFVVVFVPAAIGMLLIWIAQKVGGQDVGLIE